MSERQAGDAKKTAQTSSFKGHVVGFSNLKTKRRKRQQMDVEEGKSVEQQGNVAWT